MYDSLLIVLAAVRKIYLDKFICSVIACDVTETAATNTIDSCYTEIPATKTYQAGLVFFSKT